MFRRHPLLSLIGLLSIAGLLWAAFFLATFDLNHYREELQDKLSSTLSQPVRLGAASLSLRPGPAFDFTTIEIGSKEDRLLEADRLSLQTKLLPLLIGQLSFEKIVFHQPRVRLTLPPATEKAPAQPRPTVLLNKLLTTVRVHSLQIEQGTVYFKDLRRQNTPFELQLTDIDLSARDIYSRKRGRLQLSGQLADRPASRLQATGKLALPTDPTRWRQLRLDLSIHLNGIDPNDLCGYYAAQAGCSGSGGHLDMGMVLRGSPQEGLSFKTDLQGDNLLLKFPERYPQPLQLQNFGFSGRWTADLGLNQFDDLALQLNELQLAGHFSLQSGEADPWLEGGLSTQELPLNTIARLLPSDDRQPYSHLLQGQSLGGTLRLAYSRFAGPLSQFRQQTLPQAIKEASLYLNDGRFRFGKGPLLSGVTATATWKNQQLTLSNGSAQILESPLQFAGTIDSPFHPRASATLGAGWVLPGRHLAGLYDHPQLRAFSAEGPIPLSINMSGPLADLQWAVQSDMQACSLRYGQTLTKPAGMAGNIKLQGRLNSNELQLTNGTVQLGPVNMALTGRYPRQDGHDFFLQATLSDVDISEASLLLPALERFQLQGRVAGRYRHQGRDQALQQGRGELKVTNLGVSFPGILGGGLRQFNGRIDLFADRAEWHDLKGLLGKSAVTLGGRVNNWSQPRVELNLAAQELRANELIFPSPRAGLHKLSGQLVFAGKRTDFNNLKVTLDDGSQVAVNGYRIGGEQPGIILTATAQRANIDQVVALWQGPKKPRRSEKRQRTRVVVDAEVGEGTYQQLSFQRATATITSTAGLLRISPLQFTTGGGRCLAQIALQKDSTEQRKLTVSGHVDGVEAESLEYGRIIDKKGLVSGTMDSDFHLAGELGEKFLSTVDGGFRLAIKDGVLHKFTFLARVFSVLNVSQILTLKLPDMAREGMPFTELKGNFALRDGILTTEDLFVTSNAMNLSLIGDVDLVKKDLDLILGVKPLQTVDKVITRIPIAGWLLTGEEKALITAHFEIKGPSSAPKVQAIPATSISDKVLGIFKRVFNLPGKLITDPGEVITGQPSEPAPQAPQAP